MKLTREKAWDLLGQWTETPSLLKHARAVEIVMIQAAYRYGLGKEDENLWGITGLLHDGDYEKWPEEHPGRIVAWLREEGEEEMAYAISAHYSIWNNPRKTALDKALLACDELTGFVMACCLVRPEGIRALTPKSVEKKLKAKAFAAKVDRGEIDLGIQELGVDRKEHIQFIIAALAPHVDELGIGG